MSEFLPAMNELETYYVEKLKSMDVRMGGLQSQIDEAQLSFDATKARSDRTQALLASLRALKAKVLAPTYEVAE